MQQQTKTTKKPQKTKKLKTKKSGKNKDKTRNYDVFSFLVF